ncbi:MAG TPA: DUF6268 family outer membrane beta-barrel protein [Candidatus Methylacidiphilales bacterium]
MLRSLLLSAALLSGLALAASAADSVTAGGDLTPANDTGGDGNNGDKVGQELEVSGLHAFASQAKHGDDGFGYVSETSSHFKYVAVPKVNDDLFLRFGLEWDRFDFGTGGLHPNFGIPSTLESEAVVLGADWKPNDQWLLRLEVAPGFYGTSENIGYESMSVPVTVGAVYLKSDDVQYIYGLLFDPRGQYPVLPAAGIRWRMSDKWVLNGVLPKPRVEYEFDKKITLFAGASVNSGTFRVNEGTGASTGRPGLGGARVSYTEVGIGAGVSWKFLPGWALDAEGGYLVYREFDYFNANANFQPEPAPYVSLGVAAKF